MIKHFITAVAALAFALPLAAQAQDSPSYAQPAYGSTDEQIHGRIVSFDGGYNLQVRDERGFVDNVQLHQGTIINPTGLTLEPGMIVSINGFNNGPFLAANEIDTPYQSYGGSWYYQGHPWNYYGSGITLGFFFGSAGWWHGNYFHGGYGWDHGARIYNNVHVNNVYVNRGGAYQGHNYVAPRERGGYDGGNRGAQDRGFRDHGGERGDHGNHGDHGDHGDRGGDHHH